MALDPAAVARSRTREREEDARVEPRRRQLGRGRSDANAEDEYMDAHGGLDSPSVPPAPLGNEPPPANDAQGAQELALLPRAPREESLVNDAQKAPTTQSQELSLLQVTQKSREKEKYNYAKTPVTTIATTKSEAKPTHYQLTPTVGESTANSSITPAEAPTKWGLQPTARTFPSYIVAVQEGEHYNDIPDVNMDDPVERAMAKFKVTTITDRMEYAEDITNSRIDDLEHRINEALCECQNEVDIIKKKQTSQETRIEALEKAIKTNNQAPKNVYAKPGTIGANTRAPQTKEKDTEQVVKQRLKIHGWSPYKSDPALQLSAEEANHLIKIIKELLPDTIKDHIEFMRPFYRNFQLIIRLHNCDDIDTAFSIRAELQAVIDQENIRARGAELKVGVEPDKEESLINRIL